MIMQKQITTYKGDTLLLVEVPKDAHSFRDKFSYEGGYWLVMFEPRIEPYLAIQSVRIEGNSFLKFELIGKLSKLTDKDVELFVEHKDLRYKNYKTFRWQSSNRGKSFRALESWNSFLQHNEIDLSKEWIILKLLKNY